LARIELETRLPCPVSTALRLSLDLDVELAAGRAWRARTVAGPGLRTAGVIGLGEMVRWSMLVWRAVPMRHTSRIVTLVEDDGEGGASFVDEMVSGALGSYRHVHRFRPDADATVMNDEVSWTSRGPLALADDTIVRWTLMSLLERRNSEILRRVS
jgi:hypothetical protein